MLYYIIGLNTVMHVDDGNEALFDFVLFTFLISLIVSFIIYSHILWAMILVSNSNNACSRLFSTNRAISLVLLISNKC